MAKKKVKKVKKIVMPAKEETPLVFEIGNKRYYTLKGLLSVSPVSERHIKEEISRGSLRAFKPGKELLFLFEDVDKWITKKVA